MPNPIPIKVQQSTPNLAEAAKRYLKGKKFSTASLTAQGMTNDNEHL